MIIRSFILITLLTSLAKSQTTTPIPRLDTKGDVYKTEGINDPLIYGTTVGAKKMIMLYTDFQDVKSKDDSKEAGEKILGKGRFLEIFHKQSYGKLQISIDHVQGWRHLPKNQKAYHARTTEAHRDMFIDVLALYPKVDFNKYDYIVAKMPGRGNFAFGERDDLAIPYKTGKINLVVNIGSNNPIVLAHEVAHLMGLPDLYTIGDLEPKNPVGAWDIMSIAHNATGFIGWHRHKLGWLASTRKTYLTEGQHSIDLSPLDSKSGVSMIVIPVDNPKHPSKVFAIEIGQPPEAKKGKEQWPVGVLIYSVDATIATGKNPVVIYPKEDRKAGALFHPGEAFEDKAAPFSLKVVKKTLNGTYQLEIKVK
ncbi:MAG: M6 family metalloprotease-like protein [Cryomorphaceae bacterium]|jgi:M6 family metalloprotease-like protein